MSKNHVPFDYARAERVLNAKQPPKQVMDAIEVKPGMKIGEVGSGRGRYIVHMARRVGDLGKIFANDIDEEALEYLRVRCQREGINNVETILGTVVDPRLPAGELDLIYIIGGYHHFERPIELLKKIKPSLNSTGRLVIVERCPIKRNHPYWDDSPENRNNWEAVHKEDLINDGSQAGYKLLKILTFLPEDNIYIFKSSTHAHEIPTFKVQ